MKDVFITALTMALTGSLTLLAVFSIILATGGNASSRDYGDLFRIIFGGFVVMFLVLFLFASIGSLFS
jgi:hypothetical protein